MNVCIPDTLQGYYRLHARIYDLTRWTFLFGRAGIVRMIAATAGGDRELGVLEVGCGTGRNLVPLCRVLPGARLTGVDLCESMLEKAREKALLRRNGVRLVHAAYDADLFPERSFDVVLFSYSLTMFNPGYLEALDAARQHLAPGGLIAVADFHDSRITPYKRWMAANHVRMEGHIVPELEKRFQRERLKVGKAYGGVWEYFTYTGRKAG